LKPLCRQLNLSYCLLFLKWKELWLNLKLVWLFLYVTGPISLFELNLSVSLVINIDLWHLIGFLLLNYIFSWLYLYLDISRDHMDRNLGLCSVDKFSVLLNNKSWMWLYCISLHHRLILDNLLDRCLLFPPLIILLISYFYQILSF